LFAAIASHYRFMKKMGSPAGDADAGASGLLQATGS
jgi:hypothetical protein